jgi:hypothetical protein
MDRPEIAERTALLLLELEDLIDRTINKSGELVSHLPNARKDAGLSATFGQQVFERAGSVVGHLMQARGAIVETHNGCEAVRRALHITMDVPGGSKPLASCSNGANPGSIRVIDGDRAA